MPIARRDHIHLAGLAPVRWRLPVQQDSNASALQLLGKLALDTPRFLRGDPACLDQADVGVAADGLLAPFTRANAATLLATRIARALGGRRETSRAQQSRRSVSSKPISSKMQLRK